MSDEEPKIGDTFEHEPDCRFYHAINCPVAIECEHGYDVCPICDPCYCFKGRVLIREEHDSFEFPPLARHGMIVMGPDPDGSIREFEGGVEVTCCVWIEEEHDHIRGPFVTNRVQGANEGDELPQIVYEPEGCVLVKEESDE